MAVLAQYLATRSARALAQESFAEARRLQEEERKARERALLVAVMHEPAANATILKAGTGRTGVALLQRSAWDEARRIVLSPLATAALASAYLCIDLYNAKVTALHLAFPLVSAELVENLRESTDAKGLSESFQRAIDQLLAMGIRTHRATPPK